MDQDEKLILITRMCNNIPVIWIVKQMKAQILIVRKYDT